MISDSSAKPSTAKLERFKQIVLNDASQLKDKILNEIKEQKNKALQEAKLQISGETKLYLDKELEKLNIKQRQLLSKENFADKKALLLKRDEISDAVFDQVKEKLLVFCKTQAYKNLLVEKTKQAKQSLGIGDVKIFLRPDDMIYKDDIINAWGQNSKCSVSFSDSIKYGGILFSSLKINLIIDETFDSKFSELRREFIKISGLYLG